MTLRNILNYTECLSVDGYMNSDNEHIKEKFDDIDAKIDLLIGYCRSLQIENKALQVKISALEADLDEKKRTAGQFSEYEAFIQSKIDGFLSKLDTFSGGAHKNESSNP